MTLPRLLFALLASLFALTLSAAESESAPERDLKALVSRQNDLLAEVAKKQDETEAQELKAQLQALIFDYEEFLRKYPNFVAGYVSYALLLQKPVIGERKRAATLLLKANSMDKDLPLVKNQLGNYVAEEGRPLEALNYFLAAVQLAPKEPLYHYQVGTLLTEARDDFLKSGEWTPAAIEKAMQGAFEQAMVLAPGNIQYAYRYCESFYDLEHPEWDEALKNWRALEAKVTAPVEKQTIRLHQANVLLQAKRFAECRDLLVTVDEPVLQAQKQKLVAQLPAEPAK